jgi:hypothetical protein
MYDYTHVMVEMTKNQWLIVRMGLTDRIYKIEKMLRECQYRDDSHRWELRFELRECKNFLKHVKVLKQ